MKASGTKKGDFVICFAVFWYCVISLFLTLLIKMNVLSMDTQTTYRVIMTAVPMTFAIIVGVRRKPVLFLAAYLVTFFVLILTSVIFPENQPYIQDEGLRFLLPVCLSSALCLMSVYDINIVYKTLIIISYLAFICAISFFVLYFLGFFSIDEYSMNFSYSCLLPMLVLYNEKKIHSIIFSITLFLMVLAIGSRGAVLSYLGFVLYDLFSRTNKSRWWIVFMGILFVVMIPRFESFLSSIDITSRTMTMLENDEISDDSGRSMIQQMARQLILEHPFGLGIYGDRAKLNNAYCHNIALELMVDFGWFIGGGICLLGFVKLLKLFKSSDKIGRCYLILMIMVGIFPFFFSGSVFQSGEPWWVLGFSVLLYKKNKHKEIMEV